MCKYGVVGSVGTRVRGGQNQCAPPPRIRENPVVYTREEYAAAHMSPVTRQPNDVARQTAAAAVRGGTGRPECGNGPNAGGGGRGKSAGRRDGGGGWCGRGGAGRA